MWAHDGTSRGWGGGNTEDAILGVDQSSRSYLPGPLTPGTWTVVIGKAKLDATGGHYAIDVTCSDTATLPVLAKASYMPVTLSTERRSAVLDWARSTGGVLLEDDYDGEFLYDRKPVGALQGLDPDHVV